MLVKAKWNVKDGNGWHKAGEVFETKEDLGDAVEIVSASVKPKEKPVEVKPAEGKADEAPEQEPKKETITRAGTRRKATAK